MSAPSIEQAYIDQFSGDVRQTFQQQNSRLKGLVTIDPLAAENQYFEFIKPIEVKERTVRSKEVEPANIEHVRRRCSVKVFDGDDYIDKFERMIIRPDMRMAYASAFASAHGRKWDENLIKAMLGTAYEGRNGEKAVLFDPNQQIAANYVESGTATASNITTAKIRYAISKLVDAEAVDNDDNVNVTFVYTANQLQALLRICEELKVAGTTSESLASGRPTIFNGARWVRVNSALVPKKGNIRSVVGFVKSAVSYCETQPTQISIDWIPTRKSWLVGSDAMGDAARLQEKGVVEILCDETK